MKNRAIWTLFALAVVFALTVSAQRPADVPATMSSGKPPDTVFIEELTWAEVRDLVTDVPEGGWENPGGQMGKSGTITLPEDRFVELLVITGRSLEAGGEAVEEPAAAARPRRQPGAIKKSTGGQERKENCFLLAFLAS